MDSFQDKIVWKRMRKRENKNYRSVPSLPDAFQKILKKQQKSRKNKKIPLWLNFKPKQVGKGREREKIKILAPFRSYPTRNSKFQKNRKKIQNCHYGFTSSRNRLEKSEKERK